MRTTPVTLASGLETALGEAEVSRLASKLDSELLEPGHAGYDEARRVYNAAIDRRPGNRYRGSRFGER